MLLFSATMPKRVEQLCRDLLQNPVTVSIGTVGQANQSVKQQLVIVRNGRREVSLVTHSFAFFSSHWICPDLCVYSHWM